MTRNPRGRDFSELIRAIEIPPSAGQSSRSDFERTIEYLNLAEFQRNGIPEIPWIIPGWLAELDIALIVGVASGGKTTLAAHLAISLATGRPWLGIEPAGPWLVLYFDEEQDRLTTTRLFLRLIPGAVPSNLRVASGQGIRLDRDVDVLRLEREIQRHRPSVVILDTVNQVFGTTEENSATEVGSVYRHLFRLRNEYGVTFVLVHHYGKPRGMSELEALLRVRGSTAHVTQPSTVWTLSSLDSDTTRLKQAKRRGAPKQSLQYQYEEDGDTGPIILSPAEPPERRIDHAANWIIDYLAELMEAETKEILEAGQDAGHSRTSLERALAQLVESGTIERLRQGLYRLKQEEAGPEEEAP